MNNENIKKGDMVKMNLTVGGFIIGEIEYVSSNHYGYTGEDGMSSSLGFGAIKNIEKTN